MDFSNQRKVENTINTDQLVPHLFRSEFSKIVTVLIKHFGLDLIDAADDIASETFLSAFETWSLDRIPENPTAWLYVVAKNKARNYLSRNRKVKWIGADALHCVPSSETPIDLSAENILDSQLRALFSVCHPAISIEAQIGLALRILCGFGIDEIASAFLTSKETINKRLFRAKEILRSQEVAFEVPGPSEIEDRMEAVLTTLYLLFSEGYYSEVQTSFLREDLCQEAMRMTQLLLEGELPNRSSAQALLAMMYFHSSRFAARKGPCGEVILYDDQDQSLWDQSLVSRGASLLSQASQGNCLSRYHVEASIAYWHTVKEGTVGKWENILMLHDILLQFGFSPIAALNRTVAIAKTKGNAVALVEAEKLQLTRNHFYFMLLGELNMSTDPTLAKQHFQSALSLAKTPADRSTIQRRLSQLDR